MARIFAIMRPKVVLKDTARKLIWNVLQGKRCYKCHRLRKTNKINSELYWWWIDPIGIIVVCADCRKAIYETCSPSSPMTVLPDNILGRSQQWWEEYATTRNKEPKSFVAALAMLATAMN